MEGGNLFKRCCLIVHWYIRNTISRQTQRPCWEFTSEEIINRYLQIGEINNLAELYTNWSRAIYIDPKEDYSDIFSLDIVKLPDITHEDQFRAHVAWRYNTRGPTKDKYTPSIEQIVDVAFLWFDHAKLSCLGQKRQKCAAAQTGYY